MKQRIRGLVSLHEIPFPPASYKGKEAIVHIVQRKRRRGRRGGGRWKERKKENIWGRIEGEKLNMLPSAFFSRAPRLPRAGAPPVPFRSPPRLSLFSRSLLRG